MRALSSRRRPDPITVVPAVAAVDPLAARRAAAFARAWPLLATSIPTADIVAAYLDDVLPQ